MKQIVIPYKPRELQNFLHKKCDKNRFNVIIVHRRGGKTVFAINHLIKKALTNKRPYPRYAFISPYRLQGKSTAWDYLKQFSAAIPGTKFNESELRVDFNVNNSRIQIIGAENSSAIRGQYFDGIIVDETQNIAPDLFDTILRPCLSDRNGFAIFIGTPRGRNYFYQLHQLAKQTEDWFTCVFRASETKIIHEKELTDAKAIMSPEAYAQEMECSFQAGISGSYYGAMMESLDKNGHIKDFEIDDSQEVETWWDLGMNDSTVITFVQRTKNEIKVIDSYENSGEGLEHYLNIIDSKPYIYSKHIAPHDIRVRELGTNKSRWESAKEMGLEFDIAPKLSVEDGIEQVRQLLPKCWFHKRNCNKLVEALKSYCKRWDEKNNCFKNRPLHNWASHFADSFRYGAIVEPIERSDWKKPIRVNTNYII
jgi:phage terminase large subunit|tara:strand:- start:881 stop:2149 length:1269 start_codon:yes stop_codon:yes gene_type:complete